MSEFLSFDITKDRRILCINPFSHSGTAQLADIRDGSYYQGEWTGEDLSALIVRAPSSEERSACEGLIISQFKRRSELLEYLTDQLTGLQTLDLSYSEITSLPAEIGELTGLRIIDGPRR